MKKEDGSMIRISKKAINMLKELGTLKDTYDSIILKLIEFYKHNGENKKI